jgi:hypothetical protein
MSKKFIRKVERKGPPPDKDKMEEALNRIAEMEMSGRDTAYDSANLRTAIWAARQALGLK